MNHRLDQYLWNIENTLSAMPRADRKKEVCEIRQHLTALINAHEADGQERDVATRAAIAQFGTSREIGIRLRQAARHKQLGTLLDVFLCCAIASDGFGWTAWGLGALWKTMSPLPADLKDLASPVGPPYWGLAALMLLILRHGVKRGGWQKMRLGASSVGAAVGFFLLELLVMQSWNIVWSYEERHFPVTSLSGWSTAHLVAHHFGLCWLTAYAVGRFSRHEESIADAVGCAAAFLPVAGLLTVTVEYMPSLTELAQNPLGYLMAVGLWLVPGTLWALGMRFGVQVGEKSRRSRFPYFSKESRYESAF